MLENLNIQNMPSTLPVFPLNGVVILPGVELPLNIFEPRYINMIDDALAEKRLIGLIQPQTGFFSKLMKKKPLFNVGCVCKISAFNETSDGRYVIVVSGICRFEIIEEIDTTRQYRRFKVDYNNFKNDFTNNLERENFSINYSKEDLLKRISSYLKKTHGIKEEVDFGYLKNVDEAYLVDFLCSYMPFSAQEKQLFIESKTIIDRFNNLDKLLGILEAETKLTNILDNNKTMH